ncbi:MAG: hypothetical protein ACKVUS_00615 [Saprospiraceae bacterium]
MLQASFTIPVQDLTPALIEKIRDLLKGNGEGAEVVIKLRRAKARPTKETREEYLAKLTKSVGQYERGETVSFDSIEALENLSQN